MTDKALAIRDDMSLADLGQVMVKSKFFADTQEAAQAIVKILAGRELGFGPIASMTGVYIVKGKVALSANLMAAAVKRSGRYDYRVIEHTAHACEIAFYQSGQEIGRSRFSLEDARKAGTQNVEKYPRNMLFARAMSNGVKWHCPDVANGPIYTPDELGADVDGDGEVLDTPAAMGGGQGVIEGTAQAADWTRAVVTPPIEPPPVNGSPKAAEPPPVAAPRQAAAKKAEPEKGAAKPAEVKFRDAKRWNALCAQLAASHPRYAKDGKPNVYHITLAAAKVGFAVIDDSNMESVIEAIAARAAELYPNGGAVETAVEELGAELIQQ